MPNNAHCPWYTEFSSKNLLNLGVKTYFLQKGVNIRKMAGFCQLQVGSCYKTADLFPSGPKFFKNENVARLNLT